MAIMVTHLHLICVQRQRLADCVNSSSPGETQEIVYISLADATTLRLQLTRKELMGD